MVINGHFEEPNLWQSQCSGALFFSTDFNGAHLAYVDFKLELFMSCQFDAATDLTNTVFDRAGVQTVDFSNSAITSMQLAQMLGDGSVTLHTNNTRPLHWPTESLTDYEFLSAWDKWRTNLNADATPAPCPPTAACTAASTRCLVPKPTAPRAAPNAECWTVRQDADRAAPVAASTNSWAGKQYCTTTWATNELAKYFKPKPHHPLPHLVRKPLATVTDPLSLN